MNEQLLELTRIRKILQEASNQLCEIQAEVDEIERGIQEAPVPWYEEEWCSGEWNKATGNREVRRQSWDLITDSHNNVIIKVKCAKNARRVKGLPKLVRAVVGHFAGVHRDTDKEHNEMLEALREMGEEV